MLKTLLLSLLLVLTEAWSKPAIMLCADSLRPGMVTCFGTTLECCKDRISPYLTVSTGDSAKVWYLFLDKTGWFLERVEFTLDSETVSFDRIPTPPLVCYDHDKLTYDEAAWINVDAGVINRIVAAKKVSVALYTDQEKPRRISFPAKAQANLATFRDSAYAKLQSAEVQALLTATAKGPCERTDAPDSLLEGLQWPHSPMDVIRTTDIDTSAALYDMGTYTVRAPHGHHWVATCDSANGTLEFEARYEELKENVTGKRGSFSRIQIFSGEVTPASSMLADEAIADAFRAEQEASMLEDGVWKQQYELAPVTYGTVCVNEYRFYYYFYSIRILGAGGAVGNTMYLWLSPDRTVPRKFCAFVCSATSRNYSETFGDFIESIEDFGSVLASFHPRVESMP